MDILPYYIDFMVGFSVYQSTMVVVGTWSNMLQLLLRVSCAVNFRSKMPSGCSDFLGLFTFCGALTSCLVACDICYCLFSAFHKTKFYLHTIKVGIFKQLFNLYIIYPFFLFIYPTFNGNVPEPDNSYLQVSLLSFLRLLCCL